MTPNKIWIEHNIRYFDGLSEMYKIDGKTFKQVILHISDIETPFNDTPYILESEHLRIINSWKTEEDMWQKMLSELKAENETLKEELLALKIEFGI